MLRNVSVTALSKTLPDWLTVKETFGYIICLNVGSGLNCLTACQPRMFKPSPGLSSLLAGTKKKARIRDTPIIDACSHSKFRQLV